MPSSFVLHLDNPLEISQDLRTFRCEASSFWIWAVSPCAVFRVQDPSLEPSVKNSLLNKGLPCEHLQGIPCSCSGPRGPGYARCMTLQLRDGPGKPLFLWPLDSWPGFPPLLGWGDCRGLAASREGAAGCKADCWGKWVNAFHEGDSS